MNLGSPQRGLSSAQGKSELLQRASVGATMDWTDEITDTQHKLSEIIKSAGVISQYTSMHNEIW